MKDIRPPVHPLHGHTAAGKPVYARVVDHHEIATRFQRLNKRFALWITTHVGTMYCFYLFNVLAFLSVKAAFDTHDLQPIINWTSSNWIQLVLLPVLIVGQNLQNEASDVRSAKTFEGVGVLLDRLDTNTSGGITEVLEAIAGLHADLQQRRYFGGGMPYWRGRGGRDGGQHQS